MDNQTIKNMIHTQFMNHGRGKAISDVLPQILNTIVDNLGQGGGGEERKVFEATSYHDSQGHAVPVDMGGDYKLQKQILEAKSSGGNASICGGAVHYDSLSGEGYAMEDVCDIIGAVNSTPIDESNPWPMNEVSLLTCSTNEGVIGTFYTEKNLDLLIRTQQALLDAGYSEEDVYQMNMSILVDGIYPSTVLDVSTTVNFVYYKDTPETGIVHKFNMTMGTFNGNKYVKTISMYEDAANPGVYPTGDTNFVIPITDDEIEAFIYLNADGIH